MLKNFKDIELGKSFRVGDCVYTKVAESPVEYHCHNSVAVGLGTVNAKHMTAQGRTVFDYFGSTNVVEEA